MRRDGPPSGRKVLDEAFHPNSTEFVLQFYIRWEVQYYSSRLL